MRFCIGARVKKGDKGKVVREEEWDPQHFGREHELATSSLIADPLHLDAIGPISRKHPVGADG